MLPVASMQRVISLDCRNATCVRSPSKYLGSVIYWWKHFAGPHRQDRQKSPIRLDGWKQTLHATNIQSNASLHCGTCTMSSLYATYRHVSSGTKTFNLPRLIKCTRNEFWGMKSSRTKQYRMISQSIQVYPESVKTSWHLITSFSVFQKINVKVRERHSKDLSKPISK